MIPSWSPDDIVPVALEHDDKKDPTVWHVRRSTDEDYGVFMAMQRRLRKKIGGEAPTVEDDGEAERRVAADDTLYLADHVLKIERAWPDGQTIEDLQERVKYIRNLAQFDRARLAQVIANGRLMMMLRKQPDSPSGSGRQEPDGGGIPAEGTSGPVTPAPNKGSIEGESTVSGEKTTAEPS